jgi:hypothetical protein
MARNYVSPQGSATFMIYRVWLPIWLKTMGKGSLTILPTFEVNESKHWSQQFMIYSFEINQIIILVSNKKCVQFKCSSIIFWDTGNLKHELFQQWIQMNGIFPNVKHLSLNLNKKALFSSTPEYLVIISN